MKNASEEPSNGSPQWQASAILLYGSLGTRTPEGRRYHVRSRIVLAVLVVWMFSIPLMRSWTHKTFVDLVTAIVPGIAFIYIVLEFRRYLAASDELARRMHLESLAWTYLTGLAVAISLGGVALVTGWSFNPMWFIVLEPLRGGWLYFVSRKYQ